MASVSTLSSTSPLPSHTPGQEKDDGWLDATRPSLGPSPSAAVSDAWVNGDAKQNRLYPMPYPGLAIA